MFTGIIEEIGIVKRIENGNKSVTLYIEAEKVLEDVKPGDSICTNGVCLTVRNHFENLFVADVMPETMSRTNFSDMTIGSEVNLERAMLVGSRFGGHIVSGHIDGIGKITSYVKDDNAVWITVEAGSSILKYIIEKGSIAIDGISLTVAYVDNKCFKVSIIPMTASETTLVKKGIGNAVNLECDLVGKYIERFSVFQEEKKDITMDFLRENGFI